MALLEVRDPARSFYGVHALNGVDLDVDAGTITGLIGPNGDVASPSIVRTC
jgi:ABC-type branched-subunit amino acid transport system ATPase component